MNRDSYLLALARASTRQVSTIHGPDLTRTNSGDAKVMATAQLKLHELVDQDVISVGSDNSYIAEGFGCQTTHDARGTRNEERGTRNRNEEQEQELPALTKPAVETLQQMVQVARQTRGESDDVTQT
ncbi:hypothetical protein ACFL2H_05625 [Planctomycetota bacterium]